MEKVTQLRSTGMSVSTDIKTGLVTVTFTSDKQDVEIKMKAFDALDVGLKILVGVNTLIEALSTWASTRGETVQ